MGQSKLHSIIETVANLAVGSILSFYITKWILEAHGVEISSSQNIEVVIGCTIASFARGYGLRRLFNWLHLRQG
jgi:hypothetical protein